MGNDANIINQAYIKGNHKSISAEQLQKIAAKLRCACKIIDGKTLGTGFFCNIPFPYFNDPLPVLITCNHVLNPYSSFKGITKTFAFIVNNEKYNLSIDNSRFIYTNKEYDITIIEIKDEDGFDFNKFLDIDENIFTQKIDNYCKNLSVCLFHHENANELKLSLGIIKKTEKIKLYYTCETHSGSSGGPIINSENGKVIGIHKGYCNFNRLNAGKLIKDPIKEFYEINKNLIQYYEDEENEDNEENEENEDNEEQQQKFEEYEDEEDDIHYKNNQRFNKDKKDNKNFQVKNIPPIKNGDYSGNKEYNKNNEMQKISQIENKNENNHEHSFSCDDCVNKQCNNCLREIKNIPCHQCKKCNIVLCLDCGANLLFGKKRDDLHKHILKLTYRKNWECNICHFDYGSFKNVSFYCEPCDFDVCDICYFKEKKEKVNPMEVNDNLKNKNELIKSVALKENHLENKNDQVISYQLYDDSIHNHFLEYNKKLCTQCYFCEKFIINKPGYECYYCQIRLCLDCTDKIYKRKKNHFFHKHSLTLECKKRNNENYTYICSICCKRFSNISFHCNICPFDVCYKCYCLYILIN